MKELHDKSVSESSNKLKGGQPGLLCSNKKSEGCPPFSYQYEPNEDNLNRAFEILFNAIKRLEMDQNGEC